LVRVSWRGWGAYLVLAVDGVSMAESSSTGTSRRSTRTVVAPVLTTLAVGTIAGHVTGVSTDTADDVGGEVALFGTVILSVTNLST
jgi:hypothetical protein